MIGASAGGVAALKTITASLPADFPGAVFAVLHIPPGPTALPQVLAWGARLSVVLAEDGAPIRPGTVTVARPDHHLVLEPTCCRVVQGPREKGCRPSVDPLFRSAALHFGPRVVGVILTGALDDGTAGLMAIQERGGATVVQDPEEAAYPSMPCSALDHLKPDAVLRLAQVAPYLETLAREDERTTARPPERGEPPPR